MGHELNFNGLPGLTHAYAGLSQGNIASTSNEGAFSNPRAAALQSLEKIYFLYKLGFKEAIIPPQRRPIKDLLDSNLKAAASSSSMWTANAATVSPSADTSDGKLYFTIANLSTNFHRHMEVPETTAYFKKVFNDDAFVVHDALAKDMGDEGAANHTRLAPAYAAPGIELFVYGDDGQALPQLYPARQKKSASEQIIEQHGLDPERVVLVKQNPKAIDAGVFHNDVISTGNLNFFIYHSESFVDGANVIAELESKYQSLTGEALITHEISSISLEDAVSSYLFNSQILSYEGSMMLLAPNESRDNPRVKAEIDKMLADNRLPLSRVEYFDLSQSMRNGGGPACLRLRVVMTDAELAAMDQSVLMTDDLYNELKNWINKYYPEKLSLDMVKDDEFIARIEEAFSNIPIKGIFV